MGIQDGINSFWSFFKVFFPSIILESSDLKNIGDEGWELVDIFEEVETVHPNFGDEDYVTKYKN